MAGDQSPRAAAVRLVLGAELVTQQLLLRTDPREQRWHQERCQQQTHSRPEGESPAERIDEQAEIVGVADVCISIE